MNKHYREYWKKLLETVAFSYGKVSLYELVQKEHKHFHPSQDTTPSNTDINVFKQLLKAFSICGLKLQDFILVGDGHYSFKENSLFDTE